MSAIRPNRVVLSIVSLLPLLLAAAPGDPSIAPTTQPAVNREAIAYQSPVFGKLDGFHRIAFVMDASGSMINKMATLKDHLEKSVNSLTEEQSFNLIFFQDQAIDETAKEMLPATAGNKKKALAHLEGVTTTGTTDPIPGLEEAFRQKPDVIYLLTDGDFPDNAAVVQKIRELNKDRKVRVNTIAFVNESNTDTAFVDMLKTIASDTGGVYRHVKANEVDKK